MRLMAIIFNIILFLFTCLVLVTDGPPRETVYIVFAIWTFLTLILSPVVISRIWMGDGWLNLKVKRDVLAEQKKTDGQSFVGSIMIKVAIIFNIVFLGFHGWAFVDQYPHPEEEGFIAFIILIVLTPILNLVVLFHSINSKGCQGFYTKSKAV